MQSKYSVLAFSKIKSNKHLFKSTTSIELFALTFPIFLPMISESINNNKSLKCGRISVEFIM